MKWQRPKITPWRIIGFLLVLQAMGSAVYRFFWGLGPSTNLSNEFPWGIWIGFDVASGVALAAGGFVIAGAVYIFGLKDFKSITRPAVLTGFLGYLLVVVGLMADLGRPWNIWRPIVHWQHHSVMFEVAWCVMLYTTVLFMEFLPVFLEGFGLKRWAKRVYSAIIPFAILGVILSTLHQSSLGSLFLIVPDKLHGLWYTPFLPVFFYMTALAVGAAMVTFESYMASKAFGHKFNIELMSRLNKFTLGMLGLYLVAKVIDLAYRGNLGLVLEGSFESTAFLIEMAIGVILPIVILALPKLRQSASGLFTAAIMVVLGVVVNRMNVAITGLTRFNGEVYLPSVFEVSITVGIVAFGVLAYTYITEYFPVFEHEEHEEHGQHEEVTDVRVGHDTVAVAADLDS